MEIVSVIFAVLFQFLSSLPISESKPICPKEWKAVNNSSCIHVSNITVSWKDAKNKCNSMDNSTLVSVNNQDMNSQIVDILKNITNGSNAEFYIGLSIKKSKQFKWEDGTAYNYSNWRHPNVTNKTFPSNESVLCGFYEADFKWLLKICETERRFICQSRSYSWTTPGTTTRTPSNATRPTKRPTSSPRNNSRPSGTTTSAPSNTTRPTKRPTSSPRNNSRPSGTTNRAPSNATTSTRQPTSSPRNNSGPSGTTTSAPSNATTQQQPTSTSTSTPTTNSGSSGTTTTPPSDASGTLPLSLENKIKQINSNMTIEEILDLVKEIEEEGKQRIDNIKKDGNVNETKVLLSKKTEKIVAKVEVVPIKGNSSLKFPSDDSLGGNIMLPNSVFNIAKKTENNSDAVGITSVFLRGLGKTKNDILNSGIISTKVDVPPGVMDNLTDPVVISLPHGKPLQAGENSSCAFINVSTSKWSTKGCRVFSSNTTFTVCHCSHLTSFAVLLDVHGTHDDIPEKHKFALLIVSIVGCCIALMCFVAALIAFYLVVSERRRRKTETVAIHKNLAIAEIFALVFFLAAYVAVDLKEVCFGVAFLLHYFLMAVFFWMLIEGINLHRGLVQVFVTSSRIKFYKVLGWVTPLLFVVPTAAVGGMDYAREDFCWISQRFIWVFAGPVAFIIFVNFIILCIAIRVMIKRPRYKMNKIDDANKSNLEHELRIAFKTTVILLPLLGLTWCLGFLTTQSTTGNIVIQYLFAIINSLQGLYFFLAHCVYDEDFVRATSNTSTRVKSYFSRTMSHTGQSGSASMSSSNSTKRTSAYCNASFDAGRVFEMPSCKSEMNRNKITVDSKDPTTDTNAGIMANENPPNGVTQSPADDVTKKDNTNAVLKVPLQVKNSGVGFDAYFGTEKLSFEQLEKNSVRQDTGSPNQRFFRRARSVIVKLSSNDSHPKRANSLSEHIGRRRPLSKQTSSDSSYSGNSNTPILFSGC